MPLLPRLTPAWPRGWSGLLPLVAAGAILAIAVARRASGARPRLREILVVGAFPLYALYAGWESVVAFPDRGGATGEHELTAIFLSRDGRVRSYPVRHFTWRNRE